MKILSVIESFAHGGAETVLVDLALGLSDHTHCVLHFSRANSVAAHAPFERSLRSAGIRCIDAHWSCLTDGARRRETLGDFSPDVVLFHWWGRDPWLPWVQNPIGDARAARPAFVCVLHHAGLRPAPGYDRYVLVAPNQVPSVSHLPAERLLNIPNGVDLTRFAADHGARRPATDDQTMVVGRLSTLRAVKIPSDWVRTLASFGVPNTRFVIAGDGPMRATLMADAEALGPGSFEFPGYVTRDDVPATLRSFDVFCYATAEAEECHPLALLESLAAGVPIVAEARAGIPAIVRHGHSGLLASSVEEIGLHLHRLRADASLRRSLAAGALSDAAAFSLDVQLARYRSLLAELAVEQRVTPAAVINPPVGTGQGR
jgi:glycosyltransferase involved in cell wall biosynthesis